MAGKAGSVGMCSKGALNDGEFVAKGTLDTLSDEASGVDSLRSVFFGDNFANSDGATSESDMRARVINGRDNGNREMGAIDDWHERDGCPAWSS